MTPIYRVIEPYSGLSLISGDIEKVSNFLHESHKALGLNAKLSFLRDGEMISECDLEGDYREAFSSRP